MGGAFRLEDLPPIEGVTFLDDPHETVLATCTMPRGISEIEEADAAEAEAQAAEAAEAGESAEPGDTAEPAADTEE
jgi:hypothetical protein